MKKPVKAKIPAETNRSDYVQWLSELKLRYRSQQVKAAVMVNQAMLVFYWELGKDIAERQFENTYGSGFYKRLSADLMRELPEAKGFSPTNLKYCRYFYDLYSPLFINRQQPVDDLKPEDLFLIPWGTTFKSSADAEIIRKKPVSMSGNVRSLTGHAAS